MVKMMQPRTIKQVAESAWLQELTTEALMKKAEGSNERSELKYLAGGERVMGKEMGTITRVS